MQCGKLVDWAACVCATIDYPGPTPTWSWAWFIVNWMHIIWLQCVSTYVCMYVQYVSVYLCVCVHVVCM